MNTMTTTHAVRGSEGIPTVMLPGVDVTNPKASPGEVAAITACSPPRFLADTCAAKRSGISGCRACADVCPHGALRFTDSGPDIDADVCHRCGACTSACPVGALERAYLPDVDLFAIAAAAVTDRPSLLVFSCNHGVTAETTTLGGVVRVSLPCIQLVSDDLLVFAVARGARAVCVEPSPSCPHAPHLQPARAVEVAQAVLEARGWDGTCIEMGSPDRTPQARPTSGQEPVTMTQPLGLRYQRRLALLDALWTGAEAHDVRAVSAVLPWRQAVVDEHACTTCGACAFVCPTGALRMGDGGFALHGREAACIGCELCAHACPEDALTLAPVVPPSGKSRLLARSALAKCIGCGGPLLPEALVQQVEERLARREGASRAAVRLCERCKGSQLFDPATKGEPTRTATDEQRRDAASHRPSSKVESVAQSCGDGGVSRREFIRLAGMAASGAVAATGCVGEAGGEEAEHRYGMVIDTKRCVGCKACVIACKAENKTPPGVNYMLVTNNTLGERPDDKPLFTAKPCFHCEKPPCVDVCPVSATFKRKHDGIVVMDYDRCIGCRYCQTACPYGARFFDFGENYAAETGDGAYNPPSPEYNQFRPRAAEASPIGNVRKCMFCMHLQDENGEYDKAAGRWPACAKTCTGHAIHFGDFKDPDGDLSRLVRERQPVRLKDELGAEPNVMYLL